MSLAARIWGARLGSICVTLSLDLHAQVPTRAFPPVTTPSAPAPPTPAAPPPPPSYAPVPAVWYGSPAPTRPLATESVSSFQDRPWLIEGITGFGTPYGFLGAAVEYDFVPAVGVALGTGLTPSGATVATAVRTRYPFRTIGLGVEVGWSAGSYDDGKCLMYCFDRDETYRHYPIAHWLNAAAVFESRAASGFSFRTFIGIAVPMNPDSGECVGDLSLGRSCGTAREILMLGIGVGTSLSR